MCLILVCVILAFSNRYVQFWHPELSFAYLFRLFGVIAPKYFKIKLAFLSLDFESTLRLFQKRVVRTNFDIYVCILL